MLALWKEGRAPAPVSGTTDGQSGVDDWKSHKSYQGMIHKQYPNLDNETYWGNDVAKRWQGIAHLFEEANDETSGKKVRIPYHVHVGYDSADEEWNDIPIPNVASEVGNEDPSL